MNRPGWIEKWFSSLQESAAFRADSVPLASSKEWVLYEGTIRHRSGRFFAIVGVRWMDPAGKSTMRPFIEQREIGTLGFLIRGKGKDRELLAQAKIEPGNVGAVQLAPTCQATASNISRMHGGGNPPFAEFFAPNDPNIIRESLQSEQGGRFLGKRNRNLLATAGRDVPLAQTHRWLFADELLELLKFDHLVNTDARSVLVCSPWEALVSRTPFTRYRSSFATDLARSAAHEGVFKDINAVRKEVLLLRSKAKAPVIVRLSDLDNWELTDEGIAPIAGKPFVVRQIKVVAHGREVHTWDQPITDSVGEGRVDLICGRVHGILHFLFNAQTEVGLYNLVELGPTVTVSPGEEAVDNPADLPNAKLVAETRQSDEGGRFYQDTSLYRILDVGEMYEVPYGWQWLTLAQIQTLLGEDGWFTNEARSALALVLAWL